MDNAPAAPLPLVPVHPSERNPTIDVLRGFALLGILVVNMELFINPLQQLLFPLAPTVGTVDRFADWCVRFFAEGKFYSLFSFLFGLGFGIQLLRAEQRGRSIVPVYLRRLLVLFLIGLIHLLLIWVGDILTFYALAGIALLFFRNARPRTLVIWAVILLALPFMLNALGTAAVVVGRAASPEIAETIDRTFAVQDSTFRAEWARAYEVYAHGSFTDAIAQRAKDAGFVVFGYLVMGPAILAMFLIGLYFARRGIFADVGSHTALFGRLFRWGLLLGIAGNAVYATIVQNVPRTEPDIPLLIAMLGYAVGVPALSLAYMSGLTLLMTRAGWKERLRPIGAAGRIPLSNYLAQSLVCTLVFYGYGLGFFGQPGKAAGVLLSVALYACLVGLSVWWTSKYRYGPMEWIWRKGTYGKAF